MPEQIVYDMGGEFMVAKGRILKHDRSFYLALLSLLMEWGSSRMYSPGHRGALFERTWHIIFSAEFDLSDVTSDPCDIYQCADGIL